MKSSNTNFNKQVAWIKNFVNKSDATASDWKRYNAVAKQLGKSLALIPAEQRLELKEAYGKAMSTETLQGFVLMKPHGYAGDYEIIDKFYMQYTSPDESLAKWDEYLHSFAAVKAVRNRKTYIKHLLAEKIKSAVNEQPFEMLNLASGPARDLFEFFNEHPDANINAECIDLDLNAIGYASKLLEQHKLKVLFHHKNVLRFQSPKRYDLVWSAGLFDYFNDDIFKRLVRKFLLNVKPGGELVIGNFCTSNPDIDYMELLDWKLYHRSATDLIRLATECGADSEDITIDKEPEAVNLFLRIRKKALVKLPGDIADIAIIPS